jgi:peroxiredoxin Q/BCP
MTVPVGAQAPGFELPGTSGRTYRLADYRGRKVVLVFYPGDDTPVCTAQLKSYTDDISQFENLDAQVLAISPQGVESHERFTAKHGFSFPLLADTDKAVAEAYGILGPLGFYRRSVFVIDAEGIVRFAHRGLTGLAYQPSETLLDALRRAG